MDSIQEREPTESNTFNDSLTSSYSSISNTTTGSITFSTTASFNSRVVDVRMALSSKLQLVYYLTIALTGFVGNTTTIIVFSQRRLRSLRSSFFLTCLAITDLIFILILVIALLDELQAPVMTVPVCMLTIYLSHIASFLSSNFTLAYTSHRLIAVFFPIKATTFLKQRTNRILALTLITFACLFYSISFSVTQTTLRSNTTNIVTCQEDEHQSLLLPFLILDTLFTFIIPFSCILCMNLAIVYKLHTKFTYIQKSSTLTLSTPVLCPSGKTSTNSSVHSVNEAVALPELNKSNVSSNSNTNVTNSPNLNYDRTHIKQDKTRPFLSVRPTQPYKLVRTNLTSISPSSSSRQLTYYHGNTPIRIRSTQCRTSASAKTTKMLLAASTVFLVFNLPYHLLLLCFLILKQRPSWMLDALNIARLWFFASFCVNFFVYAICGQRFRAEVVRLFSCTFLRRYFKTRNQKKLQDRQNSIYLSHRLLPISITQLSHSN